MKRRAFLEKSMTGAVLGSTALAASAPATAQRNAVERQILMKAGHQHDHSEKTLRALAAFGVTHICSGLPSRVMDENWSVDGLTRLRRHVESFGVNLDAVPLPMSSLPIEKVENPNILLGKSPERDREIEQI